MIQVAIPALARLRTRSARCALRRSHTRTPTSPDSATSASASRSLPRAPHTTGFGHATLQWLPGARATACVRGHSWERTQSEAAADGQCAAEMGPDRVASGHPSTCRPGRKPPRMMRRRRSVPFRSGRRRRPRLYHRLVCAINDSVMCARSNRMGSAPEPVALQEGGHEGRGTARTQPLVPHVGALARPVHTQRRHSLRRRRRRCAPASRAGGGVGPPVIAAAAAAAAAGGVTYDAPGAGHGRRGHMGGGSEPRRLAALPLHRLDGVV
jgi:hypothetical protein